MVRSCAGPVDAPFVKYCEDKVAEDGLEEDHARDEVTPDVYWVLEVEGVDEGPDKRVRHLASTLLIEIDFQDISGGKNSRVTIQE